MKKSKKDEEINAALKNVSVEVLPRRINFVPAKYEYKLDISETITFSKNTENYSICYGGTKKSQSNTKPSIFDPKKLGEIKNWSQRFNVGIGYNDKSNRGFAISILFALKACPSFRQFSKFHKPTCKRVGCTLCKIYRFYEELENKETPQFPLDLNVFDRNWKSGSYGDSAEFLNNLLNVLQSDEFSTSRAFSNFNPFSTAIGQMFRIESTNKLICEQCGRSRIIKDGFWMLGVPNKVEKSISQSNKISVEDCNCESCGSPMILTETFTELPLIFTMQINNWSEDWHYKKRKFDITKILQLQISNIPYKLCAFTSYDGNTSEGGRFHPVFLSSSGIWCIMQNGKIETIELNTLNSFNPQLLFYTRNEPNVQTETSKIVQIQNTSEAESEEEINENEKENEQRTNNAIENITKSIQKQLKRSSIKKENNNKNKEIPDEEEVIVVDTTDRKNRKVNKNKKTKAVANPMEMLLKSKKVHETAKWNGVQVSEEREEMTHKWEETPPDEWDQSLDKGHVRKVKTKRPVPVENPFDKPVTKDTKEIFGKKGEKKKNKKKFFRKKKK
ncbi:ubiquitin carboxyl-terminal hydrolase 36-like [Histomonas meleagridis]|uniref:ubiquitin carboxyl-terminal hydrolase 36-like n=1 Tax=Histomonas meleagridis TaxID=135588 RepID=UPI00355A649B|nr:ubiquitin carboxyl-terminal hydrolase 36-like [Histomonas meleagridis]KAH0801298.1 ubiquitin carboxyl-terminal hydrolase 36-like [Histomonas meleagridis]